MAKRITLVLTILSLLTACTSTSYGKTPQKTPAESSLCEEQIAIANQLFSQINQEKWQLQVAKVALELKIKQLTEATEAAKAITGAKDTKH